MDKKTENPNLARDVESLLEQFDKSDWAELEIEIEGVHVYVSKKANAAGPRFGRAAAPAQAPAPQQTGASAKADKQQAEKPAKSKPAGGARDEVEIPDGMEVIRASNVGTFYRSAKPGEPPYVEVGDTVEPDTEVCLIEVMKLFSPLTAGISGKIVEVLVEDAQMVEFDQPVFIVEPS